MNIRLHVERVVLEGIPVDRRGAARFRAALQRELARLLTAQGIPPAWHGGAALPTSPAEPVSPATAPPDQLGAAVGRSVFGGFSR